MSESVFKEPPVVPFVECPHCRELIGLEVSFCPHCREEIDSDYAIASAVLVCHNTQACSVANTITTLDAFIPLALVGTFAIYFIDWYSTGRPRISTGLLFWPLIPLLAIIHWYFRYGRFQVGDDEYIKARREMRRSFTFWLVFLIVDVLLLVVTYVGPPPNRLFA